MFGMCHRLPRLEELILLLYSWKVVPMRLWFCGLSLELSGWEVGWREW